MKKILCVSMLCAIFMAIEFVGGYLADSIAIMSDAAHLLSDFLSFLISMLAIGLGSWPATRRMSFGYHRVEVIGAIISVLLIWGLTVWLVVEAIEWCVHPVEVDGKIMLITASIGLIINLSMLKVLHSAPGHHHHHHHHGHKHGHKHDHHNHNHDKKKHTHESSVRLLDEELGYEESKHEDDH